MAIDFPSSPVVDQIHLGYRFNGIVWKRIANSDNPLTTALPTNFFINPAMQHSQQNLDVASATAATVSYYVADQWNMSASISPGTAYAVRGASLTPIGNRTAQLTVVVANAAPATTAYIQMSTQVEFKNIASFMWGTARAKPAVVRFSVYGPAGTYTWSIKPGPGGRTFMANFTIANNVWTTITIPIPGDTVGTYSGTIGFQSFWTFAAGATYATGVAGWQSTGLPMSIAGSTNGAGVAGTFLVGDIGLYLDPAGTGIAPPWQQPNFITEIRRCQRWWYRAYGMRGYLSTATAGLKLGCHHPVFMHKKPAITKVGAPMLWDGAAGAALTSVATLNTSLQSMEFNTTQPTGMTAGRPVVQYYTTLDDYIAVSAR